VSEGEMSEALARDAYFEAAKGINNNDKEYDDEKIQRRIDDAFKDWER
jgi:polyhydroxyalkanoate synthesis regulator phasin